VPDGETEIREKEIVGDMVYACMLKKKPYSEERAGDLHRGGYI